MSEYLFPVTPLGAPRQTRRDAWKPSAAVLRYRAFKDVLRPLAASQGYVPSDGDRMVLTFPIPPSWPKKKQALMLGEPMRQKPDIDNCVKAVWDCLLPEDCVIAHLGSVRKVWGEEGSIGITN